MYKTYKTQGIVLKRIDWRENDLLVNIYTKDYGKIKAICKGGKNINSKMAAHLEPFSLVDLFLIKSNNLEKIAGAVCLSNFSEIKNNLEKIYYTSQAINLVNKTIKQGKKDEKVFNLLKNYLIILKSSYNFSKDKYEFLFSIFILKFLSILGYMPELYNCVICKRKLEPSENAFNYEKGGIICKNCKKDYVFNQNQNICQEDISEQTIKIFRLILKQNCDRLLKVKTNQKILNQVNKIIRNYLMYNKYD